MGDVLVFISLAAISFVVIYCFISAYLYQPKQPVKRKLAELASAANFIKFEQCAKEDKWIAELQAGIKELNYDLLVLRGEPDITVQNMAAQKMATDAIGKAEECLGMLLKRRDHHLTLAKPNNGG